MTAFPDHYATLGIDPTADQEVITAAYRALAKKYHPDTGATRGTASPERFAGIQEAYEVLGTAESRRQYDEALLEVTQRELDEHLARKQRKIAGAAADAAAAAGIAGPPPPPDLGGIRPERRSSRAGKARATGSLREMGPFIVVSILLMVVVGGLSSLFLSHAPVEEPPLPGTPAQIEASAPPPQQHASAKPPANSAPAHSAPAKPAPVPVKPVAEAPPVAKPKPPQQQAALPEQRPLFGSSLMDEPAASLPAPPPEEDDIADPLPPPAPVPKARPRTEAAVAVKPAPIAQEASAARFNLVIFEKDEDGAVTQEQANVVFASEDRCAAFGERTVLRRLEPYDGELVRPRIWYQCEEAP